MSTLLIEEIELGLSKLERKKNRSIWNSLLLDYESELFQLNQLSDRIARMGLERPVAFVSQLQLLETTESLFSNGTGESAISQVNESLTGLRQSLKKAENELTAKISEIHRQHMDLNRRIGNFEHSLNEFRNFYDGQFHAEFPDEVKKRLQGKLENRLRSLKVPACPDLTLDQDGMQRHRAAESELVSTEGVLKSLKRQAMEDLKGENAQIYEKLAKALIESVENEATPVESLLDWEKKKQHQEQSEDNYGEIEKKLDELMVKLLVLNNYPDWELIKAKAERIRGEKDPDHRKRLYDDLRIECGTRLKHARKHETWTGKVRELRLEASKLESLEGNKLLEEIETIEKKGDNKEDPEPFRERLEEIRKKESEVKEAENRLQAVVDSLRKQGYVLSEELTEVMRPNKGKLTLESESKPIMLNLPGEEDYAIRVKAIPGTKFVQTQILRYEDDMNTHDWELRDKEKEEEFCTDYAKARKELERDGLTTNLKISKDQDDFSIQTIPREKKRRKPNEGERKREREREA
jgi:hypothetical protein